MSISDDRQNKQKYNILPFLMSGEYYFSIGIKAFQKRDFNKAIKWFQKAIEIAPHNPLFQCQLSVLYTEIRAYHKANEILRKVLHVFGEEYVDCYYLIANNYAHLGLFQDAKKNVEIYLRKAPNGDFIEEAKELNDLLNMYNEIEEDEDFEDDCLFDDEDELLIYQETIFYHMENEEWDKALALLEELLMLFPDYIAAKHDYALALFHTGRQQEAMNLEEEELELNPASLHSIANLAVFHYLRGERAESLSYIETLRNVYPMNEQQKLKIAVVFAQTEHFNEALERFETLSKAKLNQHISYYKWYAVTLYQCGLQEKANQIWDEGCRRHGALQNIGDLASFLEVNFQRV
jgi:tetratricopeptide (TPR) repeat protein